MMQFTITASAGGIDIDANTEITINATNSINMNNNDLVLDGGTNNVGIGTIIT